MNNECQDGRATARVRPYHDYGIETLPMSNRVMARVRPRGRPSRHFHPGQAVLLTCTIVMLFCSLVISHDQKAAQAANPGPGNVCSWYTVRWGDTLSAIGARYHISYGTLAQVNAIPNVNLIFVNQRLCIPVKGGSSTSNGGETPSGVTASGYVNWYDYSALDSSTRPQVDALLHRAAAIYGLPANLLLAIAWQESGWYQHLIAWDGGIGVMQIMPYTAMSINAGTGIRRDPYHLWDNIQMGAQYLRWLWNGFHGNLDKIISGYNEGGWNVIHRGIFNWRYVDNVLSLMQQFRNS